MKDSKLVFRIIAVIAGVGMLVFLVLSLDSPKSNIFMLLSMGLLFISLITAMMSINTEKYIGKNKKKKKKR